MKPYFIIGGCWSLTASALRALLRDWHASSVRRRSRSRLGFRLVKVSNKVPDSGEGEKPDPTCSNGEQP